MIRPAQQTLSQQQPDADCALADLYTADETAWLERMAGLIASDRWDELDFPHLAEYLSDMARRDKREVESRLLVLMRHALKWEFQPERHTPSWRLSIVNGQHEIKKDAASGVLRPHALEQFATLYPQAVKEAGIETGLSEDAFPPDPPWDLDGLLTFEAAET